MKSNGNSTLFVIKKKLLPEKCLRSWFPSNKRIEALKLPDLIFSVCLRIAVG